MHLSFAKNAGDLLGFSSIILFTIHSHSSRSIPGFAVRHLPPLSLAELTTSFAVSPLPIILQSSPKKKKSRQYRVVCPQRTSPWQVCHVEPASTAPLAEGAFRVWHSINRMQTVHCMYAAQAFVHLELTFLYFLSAPHSRHPSTSLPLTRLQRDLQGNCCFLYFHLHPPLPPQQQPPLVVFQQRVIRLLQFTSCVLQISGSR